MKDIFKIIIWQIIEGTSQENYIGEINIFSYDCRKVIRNYLAEEKMLLSKA